MMNPILNLKMENFLEKSLSILGEASAVFSWQNRACEYEVGCNNKSEYEVGCDK